LIQALYFLFVGVRQQPLAMEDRGPEFLIIVIVFLVLSWLTVLARCYVRIFMIKAFAVDDWLILVTLGFFSIYSGIAIDGVYWGLGRHTKDLSVRNRVNAMHVSHFFLADCYGLN
jgi:hypothetical protein